MIDGKISPRFSPGLPAHGQPAPWHSETAHTVRSLDSLLASVDLRPSDAPYALCARGPFAVRVPISFVKRMRGRDWFDPLLLQVIPRAAEKNSPEEYSDNPVGDCEARKTSCLLHKYRSRALVLASGSCPIHCRFCFRRAFPGPAGVPALGDPALWEYVRANRDIEEIILSGGEPLMLDNDTIAGILAHIASLDTISTCRIHTRMPVAVPSRIDDALVHILWSFMRSKNLVIVIHANCAQEFDQSCENAIAQLRSSGAMLLGQTVLLKDINDSAESLVALYRTMIKSSIIPYYMHQLDRVKGAAHFEVSEARGKELMQTLRQSLPGYMVPRYVREKAGQESKSPIY